MKLEFIPAKSAVDVRLTSVALNKLPKLVFGVVTTVQHIDEIGSILDQLPQSKLAGQILGCNALNAEDIAEDVDAFLFVGTGLFHPLNLAYKTGKPVWMWDPVSKVLKELDRAEADRYKRTKQNLLTKFFAAGNIGLIVSLKWGQKYFLHAVDFSERKDKNYYLFVTGSVDLSELENFPFVDCWVNCACPRLADDKAGLINLDDLAEHLKHEFRPLPEKPIWRSRL